MTTRPACQENKHKTRELAETHVQTLLEAWNTYPVVHPKIVCGRNTTVKKQTFNTSGHIMSVRANSLKPYTLTSAFIHSNILSIAL